MNKKLYKLHQLYNKHSYVWHKYPPKKHLAEVHKCSCGAVAFMYAFDSYVTPITKQDLPGIHKAWGDATYKFIVKDTIWQNTRLKPHQ